MVASSTEATAVGVDAAPAVPATDDAAASPAPGRGSFDLRLAALFAVATTVYGLVVLTMWFDLDGRRAFTLIDDAMISMRYADNLSRGSGLVWNVGEEPVQGFTNVGYTLVLSVTNWLVDSATNASLAAVGVTSTALLLTSWAAARLVRLLLPASSRAPLVAAAAVAFNFGLVFWTTRGMEVSLVAAGVTLSALWGITWLCDRRSRFLALAGVAAAFAVFIRLDSLPPVLVAFGLLAAIASRTSTRDAALVGVAGAIPVGAALSIALFQFAYFGDPLPNTYYLKTEGVRLAERLSVGWESFVRNALGEILVLVLISLAGLVLVRPSRRTAQAMLVLASIAAVSVLYSIWVGGDYAEPQVHAPNRFMLVGIPSLIVVAVLSAYGAIDRLGTRDAARRRLTTMSAFAATLALILAPNLANWGHMVRGEVPLLVTDQRRANLGAHLARSVPPDAVIAVHAAGQIPFYSGLEAIDLLGKSDVHVARLDQTSERFRSGHNKWDYAYSIGRLRPDVVADEWGSVADYLSATGGYLRLPNGVWVSEHPSVPLDVTAIGACYWKCG